MRKLSLDYLKAAAIFVGAPAAVLGSMYLFGTEPILAIGAAFTAILLVYAFTQA